MRAIGYLIALPFVVVLFLLQTVFVVATVLVDATIAVLWAVLRVLGKLLGIAAVGGVHTARWSAQTAAPVAGWAGQQWRPMMIWTGEKARQSARHALTAAVFVGRWIASTKDDFLGDAGRDVNPVSLAAKLLTIAVAAIAVGVLMVKAIQAVVHSN